MCAQGKAEMQQVGSLRFPQHLQHSFYFSPWPR